MTENINDHKTYSLTFRFLSGEFIYEDEYIVYFNSEDFENNLNKQPYNKNEKSIRKIIDDYYIHQYHSLDFDAKNDIWIFHKDALLSDDEIDKNYNKDELAKQYIDYEIYNNYDPNYFNELRKLYIYYIKMDDCPDGMLRTDTSYIFDNKSFPSTYSLYNYIFKNNDKLTETNYEITVAISMV